MPSTLSGETDAFMGNSPQPEPDPPDSLFGLSVAQLGPQATQSTHDKPTFNRRVLFHIMGVPKETPLSFTADQEACTGTSNIWHL